VKQTVQVFTYHLNLKMLKVQSSITR